MCHSTVWVNQTSFTHFNSSVLIDCISMFIISFFSGHLSCVHSAIPNSAAVHIFLPVFSSMCEGVSLGDQDVIFKVELWCVRWVHLHQRVLTCFLTQLSQFTFFRQYFIALASHTLNNNCYVISDELSPIDFYCSRFLVRWGIFSYVSHLGFLFYK